ncbi:MAG: hypothetical protein P4M11_05490 [Candidatus Pacebacteria bacterium]|nr:hypothetical protein [Candidatus Paceibacterota bacterium]
MKPSLLDMYVRVWESTRARGFYKFRDESPDISFDDFVKNAYADLIAHYQEGQRVSNTLDHVEFMLNEFSDPEGILRREVADPDSLEFALFYYRSRYEPGSNMNERRSAEFAQAVMLAGGVPPAICIRTFHLILDAQPNTLARTTDSEYFEDIRHAILGSPLKKFHRYEDGIRRELMSYLTLEEYFEKRTKDFQSLLEREQLFNSPYFQQRCERRARANLSEAIDSFSTRH